METCHHLCYKIQAFFLVSLTALRVAFFPLTGFSLDIKQSTPRNPFLADAPYPKHQWNPKARKFDFKWLRELSFTEAMAISALNLAPNGAIDDQCAGGLGIARILPKVTNRAPT